MEATWPEAPRYMYHERGDAISIVPSVTRYSSNTQNHVLWPMNMCSAANFLSYVSAKN